MNINIPFVTVSLDLATDQHTRFLLPFMLFTSLLSVFWKEAEDDVVVLGFPHIYEPIKEPAELARPQAFMF